MKTFTVHQSVITFYSGYFEAALRPGSTFQEATTKIFKLQEEDAVVFEKFIAWTYSRRIDHDPVDKTCSILCKLWVLADRRQVPLLMNECINAMRDRIVSNWELPSSCLSYIYKHTMAKSALRRLVVDIIGKSAGESLFDNGDKYFGRDTLLDILKVVLARSETWSKEDVREAKLCPEYHVHEEGVTCEKN